jgi:hypothetical protein
LLNLWKKFKNDPKLVKRLEILAEGLLRKYDQDQLLSTLEEAEDTLNQVVLRSATAKSAIRSFYDSHTSSLPMGKVLSDIKNLDEAVRIMEDSLTTAPEGTHYVPSGLHELGFILMEKYKMQGYIEGLMKATKIF